MDEDAYEFSLNEDPEKPEENVSLNVNETEVNNYSEQNEVIPQSHLLSVLNKKNADIMVLVDDWLSTYENCSFEGIKEIIELIYHSTGWMDFVFDSKGLDEKFIKKFIRNKDGITLTDPSSLKVIFLDRFASFFNELLKLNDSQLLLTESFVSPIISSCTLLMSGSWTSFRMIAVTAGIKLMTRLQILNDECLKEFRESTKSAEVVNQFKIKKDYLFIMWYKLFLQVCSLSFRDKIAEVRNVTLKEMQLWASENPSILLGKKWKKYLYIALRDSNLNNRKDAFKIISYLFYVEIDVAKQKDLFNYLKVELLYTLHHMKGFPALVSINAVCDIFQYANVEMNDTELAIIYLCVYNESQVIATKAAHILMIKLKKLANTPAELINGIIIFERKPKLKQVLY